MLIIQSGAFSVWHFHHKYAYTKTHLQRWFSRMTPLWVCGPRLCPWVCPSTSASCIEVACPVHPTPALLPVHLRWWIGCPGSSGPVSVGNNDYRFRPYLKLKWLSSWSSVRLKKVRSYRENTPLMQMNQSKQQFHVSWCALSGPEWDTYENTTSVCGK